VLHKIFLEHKFVHLYTDINLFNLSHTRSCN